jgi:putative ABC transport system substrate-binding protein
MNGRDRAATPALTCLICVVLLWLVMPLTATAQGGKVPRIGVLLPGSREPEYERRLDLFRQGLREGGYVEGQNVLVEYRWAEAKRDRIPALLAELINLKVDVLVVDSTPAAVAAKKATPTIPIVLAIVSDPVASGLVRTLARPGGNITGMSLMTPELDAKRLELIKEVASRARRIAVLLNPGNSSHALRTREVQIASSSLHLELQTVEVRSPTDFERAFRTIAAGRPDVLFVFEDPLFIPAHQTEIVEFAVRHRLPTVTGLKSFVEVGGLMSFGPSFSEMFRDAAAFVVKILKGAKPSDLPLQQPNKFELVVNVKTAKALGLTIPPSLLLRADQIIE